MGYARVPRAHNIITKAYQTIFLIQRYSNFIPTHLPIQVHCKVLSCSSDLSWQYWFMAWKPHNIQENCTTSECKECRWKWIFWCRLYHSDYKSRLSAYYLIMILELKWYYFSFLFKSLQSSSPAFNIMVSLLFVPGYIGLAHLERCIFFSILWIIFTNGSSFHHTFDVRMVIVTLLILLILPIFFIDFDFFIHISFLFIPIYHLYTLTLDLGILFLVCYICNGSVTGYGQFIALIWQFTWSHLHCFSSHSTEIG